ncbi:XdhC family protein [Kineosporia sp. J2-2]|uniref:XdhC family protein n=1 Tax=Kineosporia corallincola TaxID=2835133 RepID=A0ABS5TDC1_9ACTN|nr:XdhC family protein [Kineosporia corallincola]MBT0768191.1 XdhC family protein [Kineosporia corallincola]
MLTDVWPFVEEQRHHGRDVVLARLVGRDGPGSRPLGATMAVTRNGSWRGSLSGGCVEGIVLRAATDVLEGREPHLMTVVVGDDLMPWEEAPACGGELQVLLTPAPGGRAYDAITQALHANEPLAVRVGLTAPFGWDTAPEASRLTAPGGFVEQLPTRPRLLLVGATDLAAELAALAGPLRFEVVVIDPRQAFVDSGALPAGTRTVLGWPDRWLAENPPRPDDAVVVLTHDPRIDDRGIRAALAGGAGYVAALGSRATHAQRMRRLGHLPGIGRLCGPAGLDLGGQSPAETALSILAEVVAARHGRAGGPLRTGDLPIRPPRGPVRVPSQN